MKNKITEEKKNEMLRRGERGRKVDGEIESKVVKRKRKKYGKKGNE